MVAFEWLRSVNTSFIRYITVRLHNMVFQSEVGISNSDESKNIA